jgi:hypothetical protein
VEEVLLVAVSSEMLRSYAQECLRLAEEESGIERKTLLVTMAEAWYRLAKDSERIERHSEKFEEPKGK